MGLSDYRRKPRSGRRPEQPRRRRGGTSGPQFVIQHHAARNDHYEFQLEIDGVLVSWAIPRGPTVSPQERRMARRTHDHPLDESATDGMIADEDDGAGVIVLDRGTYANITGHAMATCLGRGHLSFLLNGEKLHGGYALTRVREGDDETWLLVKRRDAVADASSRLNR